MRYWKNVQAQAWKETIELVRLDNPGRIVMTIALALVPAIIVWLMLGDHAQPLDDPIVRGLASLGTAAFLAMIFYGAKLLSVPPRREAEMLTLHSQQLAAAEAATDAAKHELEKAASQVPPNFQKYNSNLWEGDTSIATAVGTPYLDLDGTLVFPELMLRAKPLEGSQYRFNAEVLSFVNHGGMASGQIAGQAWSGKMLAARFRVISSLPSYVALRA